MIYLDSSAAVKLLHNEADSTALRQFLGGRPEIDWVSSALVEVETYRALARATASADMPIMINDFHMLLDLIDRVEIDSGIRLLGQTINPPSVRSLDAIHLATDLRLHDHGRLTCFVTYDNRLADAATAAGLAVQAPAD